MKLIELFPTYESYIAETYTKINSTNADRLFQNEAPVWADDNQTYYSSRLIYNAFLSEYGEHTLNFSRDRFLQKFLMFHIDMLPTLYARTAALNNVFLNTFNTEEILKTVSTAFLDNPETNYQEVISADRSSNVKGFTPEQDEIYRTANITRSVDKTRTLSEFKNLLTKLQELNNVAIDGEILDFVKGAEFSSLFTYDISALAAIEVDSNKMNTDFSNMIQEKFEEVLEASNALMNKAAQDLSNVTDTVFSTKWYESLAGGNTTDSIVYNANLIRTATLQLEAKFDALYNSIAQADIDIEPDELLVIAENGTIWIDISQYIPNLGTITNGTQISLKIEDKTDPNHVVGALVYATYNDGIFTPGDFFGDTVEAEIVVTPPVADGQSDLVEFGITGISSANINDKYLSAIRSRGTSDIELPSFSGVSAFTDITNWTNIELGQLNKGSLVKFTSPTLDRPELFGYVARIEDISGIGGAAAEYNINFQVTGKWTVEGGIGWTSMSFDLICSLRGTSDIDGANVSIFSKSTVVAKNNLKFVIDQTMTGALPNEMLTWWDSISIGGSQGEPFTLEFAYGSDDWGDTTAYVESNGSYTLEENYSRNEITHKFAGIPVSGTIFVFDLAPRSQGIRDLTGLTKSELWTGAASQGLLIGGDTVKVDTGWSSANGTALEQREISVFMSEINFTTQSFTLHGTLFNRDTGERRNVFLKIDSNSLNEDIEYTDWNDEPKEITYIAALTPRTANMLGTNMRNGETIWNIQPFNDLGGDESSSAGGGGFHFTNISNETVLVENFFSTAYINCDTRITHAYVRVQHNIAVDNADYNSNIISQNIGYRNNSTAGRDTLNISTNSFKVAPGESFRVSYFRYSTLNNFTISGNWWEIIFKLGDN